MATSIQIGMTRARLLQFAEEIQTTFEDEGVHYLTLQADSNNGNYWVDLEFSNDDMEDRDMDNRIIVDIDND